MGSNDGLVWKGVSPEYQHFDALIWQVPTWCIAITTGILFSGMAVLREPPPLESGTGPLVAGLILLVGLGFLVVLGFVLLRYRMLQREFWYHATHRCEMEIEVCHPSEHEHECIHPKPRVYFPTQVALQGVLLLQLGAMVVVFTYLVTGGLGRPLTLGGAVFVLTMVVSESVVVVQDRKLRAQFNCRGHQPDVKQEPASPEPEQLIPGSN